MSGRRFGGTLAAAALALLFWAVALAGAQRIAQRAQTVSVRLETGSLTLGDWRTLEKRREGETKEEPRRIALWTQHTGQQLSGMRSASGSVTEVEGEISLAPGGTLLAGSWPEPGDTQGCAVSEEAADALWGNAAPLNGALEWGEKRYFVRAVYDGTGIMVPAREESTEFCALEIESFSGENGEEAARQFLLERGISQVEAILDRPFLAQCLSWIASLPSWVLAFAVAARWLSAALREKRMPLRRAGLTALALLAVGGMLWIGQCRLFFPQRWIPGRWSDFDFWSRLSEEIREIAGQALGLQPAGEDLALRKDCMTTVLAAAAAAVIWAFAAWRIRPMQLKEILFVEAGSVLCAFFAAAWLGIGAARGFWAAWPAAAGLLALPDALKKGEKSLGRSEAGTSLQML